MVDGGMISHNVGHIAGLALNVRDLDRAVDFYVGALGFTIVASSADHARLALGSQRIELVRQPNAVSYPEPRAANDPWFQHFAIAVADMGVAYQRLLRFSPEPITRGGPQLLPPSTGSVTAYKFRDPDGHPLELSHAPGSSWSHAAAPDGTVFLGIDHTALAVDSLEASIAFYTALGFRSGARSLNQGPEQARLDGLDDAVVDIVTLLTPDAGRTSNCCTTGRRRRRCCASSRRAISPLHRRCWLRSAPRPRMTVPTRRAHALGTRTGTCCASSLPS